jgi:hypothetical protein
MTGFRPNRPNLPSKPCPKLSPFLSTYVLTVLTFTRAYAHIPVLGLASFFVWTVRTVLARSRK